MLMVILSLVMWVLVILWTIIGCGMYIEGYGLLQKAAKKRKTRNVILFHLLCGPIAVSIGGLILLVKAVKILSMFVLQETPDDTSVPPPQQT